MVSKALLAWWFRWPRWSVFKALLAWGVSPVACRVQQAKAAREECCRRLSSIPLRPCWPGV